MGNGQSNERLRSGSQYKDRLENQSSSARAAEILGRSISGGLKDEKDASEVFEKDDTLSKLRYSLFGLILYSCLAGISWQDMVRPDHTNPNECQIIYSDADREDAHVRVTVFTREEGSKLVAVKSLGIRAYGPLYQWKALRSEFSTFLVPQLRKSRYVVQIEKIMILNVDFPYGFYVHVVMEAAECNFKRHLEYHTELGLRLSLTEKSGLFEDILQGLAQLHSVGIAHSDLKLQNILIYRVNEPDRIYRAKVADLGNAFSEDFELDGFRKDMHQGTHFYEAPEIGALMHGIQMAGAKILEPSNVRICDMVLADYYSLGLLYLEGLLDGTSPYSKIAELEICESASKPEVCIDRYNICESIVLPLKVDQERIEKIIRKSFEDEVGVLQPTSSTSQSLHLMTQPEEEEVRLQLESIIVGLCQVVPENRIVPTIPFLPLRVQGIKVDDDHSDLGTEIPTPSDENFTDLSAGLPRLSRDFLAFFFESHTNLAHFLTFARTDYICQMQDFADEISKKDFFEDPELARLLLISVVMCSCNNANINDIESGTTTLLPSVIGSYLCKAAEIEVDYNLEGWAILELFHWAKVLDFALAEELLEKCKSWIISERISVESTDYISNETLMVVKQSTHFGLFIDRGEVFKLRRDSQQAAIDISEVDSLRNGMKYLRDNHTSNFADLLLLSASILGADSILENIFLNETSTINYCDGDGRTPLFLACSHANLSTAVTLLNKGASASILCDGIGYPLHLVHRFYDVSHTQLKELSMRLVVQISGQSTNINHCDDLEVSIGGCTFLRTPLFNAVYEGNEMAVRILLELGASPLAGSYSALVMALAQWRVPIVRLMLENINPRDLSSLEIDEVLAALFLYTLRPGIFNQGVRYQQDLIDTIRLILKLFSYKEYRKSQITLVSWLIFTGYGKLLPDLLKCFSVEQIPYEINQISDLGAPEFLNHHRNATESMYLTPIQIALLVNDAYSFRYLWSIGARISDRGRTGNRKITCLAVCALSQWTSDNESCVMARELLEIMRKEDLVTEDSMAIAFAIGRKKENLVQLLLRLPDENSMFSGTRSFPMDIILSELGFSIAYFSGSLSLLQSILSTKPDFILHRSAENVTALMLAARYSSYADRRDLPDPDCPRPSRSELDAYNLAKALLYHFPDPDHRKARLDHATGLGATALHIACMHLNYEWVYCLLEHDENTNQALKTELLDMVIGMESGSYGPLEIVSEMRPESVFVKMRTTRGHSLTDCEANYVNERRKKLQNLLLSHGAKPKKGPLETSNRPKSLSSVRIETQTMELLNGILKPSPKSDTLNTIIQKISALEDSPPLERGFMEYNVIEEGLKFLLVFAEVDVERVGACMREGILLPHISRFDESLQQVGFTLQKSLEAPYGQSINLNVQNDTSADNLEHQAVYSFLKSLASVVDVVAPLFLKLVVEPISILGDNESDPSLQAFLNILDSDTTHMLSFNKWEEKVINNISINVIGSIMRGEAKDAGIAFLDLFSIARFLKEETVVDIAKVELGVTKIHKIYKASKQAEWGSLAALLLILEGFEELYNQKSGIIDLLRNTFGLNQSDVPTTLELGFYLDSECKRMQNAKIFNILNPMGAINNVVWRLFFTAIQATAIMCMILDMPLPVSGDLEPKTQTLNEFIDEVVNLYERLQSIQPAEDCDDHEAQYKLHLDLCKRQYWTHKPKHYAFRAVIINKLIQVFLELKFLHSRNITDFNLPQWSNMAGERADRNISILVIIQKLETTRRKIPNSWLWWLGLNTWGRDNSLHPDIAKITNLAIEFFESLHRFRELTDLEDETVALADFQKKYDTWYTLPARLLARFFPPI